MHDCVLSSMVSATSTSSMRDQVQDDDYPLLLSVMTVPEGKARLSISYSTRARRANNGSSAVASTCSMAPYPRSLRLSHSCTMRNLTSADETAISKTSTHLVCKFSVHCRTTIAILRVRFCTCSLFDEACKQVLYRVQVLSSVKNHGPRSGYRRARLSARILKEARIKETA